jgi:hypothetical protein
MRHDSHTNTFISADVYNTTVDKIALREVAEYFSAIPSIIGIMLNNHSLRTRAALQSNTTWSAATLRRDLVCAWYTLIDVALFSSTSRSRHIHNMDSMNNPYLAFDYSFWKYNCLFLHSTIPGSYTI